MKLRAIISPAARQQTRQIKDWWRNNRRAAAKHVGVELERVLEVLCQTPFIGELYPNDEVPDVRRYRLQKTPYHLYYLPNMDTQTLYVLALWSGMREYGPPLKKP